MKTLDYYMSLPYRMELVPDPDEGGFVVSFPELHRSLAENSRREGVSMNQYCVYLLSINDALSANR